MTDAQIIRRLLDTGHLNYPFGIRSGAYATKNNIGEFSIRNAYVVDAIRSWQDFMVHDIDRLAMAHYGRHAMADGELGPAGLEVMAMDRCRCPDYGPDVVDVDRDGRLIYGPDVQKFALPALGSGNWKRCHGIGEFHCAKVHIDDAKMPSFLRPLFDKIWELIVAAFDQIGMHFIRTDDKREANIHFSFVTKRTGWIGLAIRTLGLSCSSTPIWCQFQAGYHPGNIIMMWFRLIAHELLHNLGCSHTRSGILAPVLTSGPTSLINDPIMSLLKKLYGGEPIPGDPDDKPIIWDEHCLHSTTTGRKVCVALNPPIVMTEQEARAMSRSAETKPSTGEA